MHLCHAHGCKKVIPPRLFACREHWFALPKKVRDAVLREYRPGQEIDKNPSFRYMAVQQLAVCHTAFQPHDEEAARVAASYLRKAVAFQVLAIEAGLGDPLVGLLPEDKKDGHG